jgi:hypothetical protein
VLVDVSRDPGPHGGDQEAPSQLDLHNYLKAAIGIRRYRTLSLPTSVTAAEGFRERGPRLRHHSVAGMIRAPAAARPSTSARRAPISVVVRTGPAELLRQALQPRGRQLRNVQVVVVNDGGET